MAEDLKLVEMGFIKTAFGIKGWVKVSAQTEYEDSLFAFDLWHLGKNGQWQTFEVEEGKVVPDGLIVKFVGINDRNQAEALRGLTIAVPRTEFAETEEDEYYWTDLVGMQVVNLEKIILGEVIDLMQTGAHDLLVLKGEHGQKLIPFVGQFVHEVDKAQRLITVDWGLDY